MSHSDRFIDGKWDKENEEYPDPRVENWERVFENKSEFGKLVSLNNIYFVFMLIWAELGLCTFTPISIYHL